MAAHAKPATLAVPARLHTGEAAALKARLAECRGRPVTLDFTPVVHVGTQCLQVLMAARQAWTGDGRTFEITNLSAGVRSGLRTCGIDPGRIGAMEFNDAP